MTITTTTTKPGFHLTDFLPVPKVKDGTVSGGDSLDGGDAVGVSLDESVFQLLLHLLGGFGGDGGGHQGIVAVSFLHLGEELFLLLGVVGKVGFGQINRLRNSA